MMTGEGIEASAQITYEIRGQVICGGGQGKWESLNISSWNICYRELGQKYYQGNVINKTKIQLDNVESLDEIRDYEL